MMFVCLYVAISAFSEQFRSCLLLIKNGHFILVSCDQENSSICVYENKRKKKLNRTNQTTSPHAEPKDWSEPLVENDWFGFLCLHGFRGLLFLDRFGLAGADAYKALELFHEDEH